MTHIRFFIVALLFLVQVPLLARQHYQAQGTCAGLPRVPVKNQDGFCLGIAASGLKFPRGLESMPNGDLIVADMGAWVENHGSIWLLKKSGTSYRKTLLLNKLDRPNSVAIGPDGRVYVGLVGRVIRFDLSDPEHTVTDIIGGNSSMPPLPGIGRHPLSAIIFDKSGDLFVNVGSATDHCEDPDGNAPKSRDICPETAGNAPRGVIRKYRMQWPAGKAVQWENYAYGLRNSMALAIHPLSGELWQAENSRDSIQLAMPSLNDEELPHDELNLVKPDSHYGWPYCFDNNQPSPEYPAWDCSAYRIPELLLPAHAAPLGMTFYTKNRFPKNFNNSLIVAFHGYRKYGHRIVAIPFDKTGKPTGKIVDLAYDWGAKPNQPMGAPVAVTIGDDGAVYVTEDRNGTVLRLDYSDGR